MTLPALIVASLLALFALPLVSQMSGSSNSASAAVRAQKHADKTTAADNASSKDASSKDASSKGSGGGLSA
jgi:hypothetical protein